MIILISEVSLPFPTNHPTKKPTPSDTASRALSAGEKNHNFRGSHRQHWAQNAKQLSEFI